MIGDEFGGLAKRERHIGLEVGEIGEPRPGAIDVLLRERPRLKDTGGRGLGTVRVLSLDYTPRVATRARAYRARGQRPSRRTDACRP